MTEHHQVVRPEQVPTARTAPEPILADAAPPTTADEAAQRRPKRSRRWWLAVTGSIAGCGVLAAAITLGPMSYSMISQKDAVLTTPAQAAGLTLDTTERATAAADDLKSVFTAAFTVTSSVAGVYGDPRASTRSVLFVGGTGFLARPDRELGEVFSLLDDQAGHVTGVRDVDPGPLAGTMRCGAVTSTDGTAMSVCGWADYGSLAMAMFPDRGTDESARLMRDLRAAIQSR